MSQENVEIVRKGIEAFFEQRFAHAFKVEDGKTVEWRMFGPVEEVFEALGLSEQDLHGV